MPERYIKIGLKDDQVVCVDWSDFAGVFNNKYQAYDTVITYLKQAQEFIRRQ